MPLVPEIVRQRQKRRASANRSSTVRAGLGSSMLFSLFFLAASFALITIAIDLTRDLPSLDRLPLLLDPPSGALLQPTRLLDRSGQHVLLTLENPAARHPSVARRYLSLDASAPEHLPESLAQATVVVADPGFWNHPGFTLDGTVQGSHPTLAQRLVADLLLWEEPPGLRRNLRERLLAGQITARYSREKVLEWYLNSAKYGYLVYGADAAARLYFDKPASSLSLAEAALLAAVAEAPELNPQQAPQVPLERQKAVLQAMLSQGWISGEQARQAAQEILRFRQDMPTAQELAPAFTRLALEQLAARFPIDRLERGGLRVRTSLDYDLQVQAGCATQVQIDRSSSLQPTLGEPVSADGSPCEAARLLPTLPLPGDVMTTSLAAQVIVLEPITGEVLAMVGDILPGLDPAHLPGYAPGTLLTPFIYLTAFTRGWSPASLVWDIPLELPGPQMTANISEGNSQPGAYHGPVSLRAAFANDYLTPAIGILSQIGPEHVWRIAQQLGLTSLELTTFQNTLAQFSTPDQSSVLSSGETTLLELCQAFGVFASQGILAGQDFGTSSVPRDFPSIQPITVLEMEDTDHQLWLDCLEQLKNCSPLVRPVVSPQLAYLVTHILSDETARWPSLKHPNPLEIGRPAAAKIGQTSAGDHAWTVGYTPQIVVGVWAGNPNHLPTRDAAITASALWHAVIQYASRDDPALNWRAPAGISSLDVCEPSGMLPTSRCPNIVTEIFLTGNEPTYPDTLYRSFQVNRETGRLATVFTSPELVEERVYLVVPAQAQAWARIAGLSTPPDAYDVISLPQPASPLVRIDSPAMFAYVKGKVPITGTAGGEDFAFYRLQAGKGLNPQEWLQIGEDSQNAVEKGILGEWDSGGLDGLYAIQLLVVRKDQRIETAIIQVTVDNQAPRVTILRPAGEQVSAASRTASGAVSAENGVVFEAMADDNLGLDQVEFYVDGEWVASLKDPPFAIAWKISSGKHILLVRVVDLAGNASEAKKEFVVTR